MAEFADTGTVGDYAPIVMEPVDEKNTEKRELDLAQSHVKEAARAIAETVVADAVSLALMKDGRGLRELEREFGLKAPSLSRLSKGKNCTVRSLAELAFVLGKKLRISIE